MRSTAPFAVSAAPSRARGRWLRAPVRRTTAAIASPTNGPDEVASVTSRVHVARTPQTFEYDYDGNQTLVTTKTGTWRVTYNGENRPVRWTRINAADTNDQTTVLMSFDHQGRRRMYLEVNANGTTNRLDRFTYDNYLCVARNRWQPDGTSAADRVVWDPTEPVATRPLVFYQSNDPPQFYAIDGNKNVSELVSYDDGTISAHYEYSSFGEVILSSGDLALANPFRFSSEYSDDALGLVYYNYRHFEPMMGRWVQRDPIGEKLDVIVYPYVNNQPQGKEDFLGLFDDGGYVCVETQGVYEQVPFGGFVYKEVCVRWECKKGHKDFPNNGTKCPFDYTKEDDDWKTAPWWPWGIGNHFKKAEDIEGKDSGENDWDDIENHESYEGDNLIRAAISGCDAAGFESLMHQLQDTRTHYDRGWRTWKIGHLFGGTAPDLDDYAQTTAWDLAKRDTEKYVKLWNDKCKLCCESKCKWRRK